MLLNDYPRLTSHKDVMLLPVLVIFPYLDTDILFTVFCTWPCQINSFRATDWHCCLSMNSQGICLNFKFCILLYCYLAKVQCIISLFQFHVFGCIYENLSGFLWIGNTQRITHERLIRPRMNLDELLIEGKWKVKWGENIQEREKTYCCTKYHKRRVYKQE